MVKSKSDVPVERDLKLELKIIKEAGIILYKSKREGFVWFLPAISKEMPKGITHDNNSKKQAYGTHYTEEGIIHLANKLINK